MKNYKLLYPATIALLLFSKAAFASETFWYDTYRSDTELSDEEARLIIKNTSFGKNAAKWIIKKNNYLREEEYWVDEKLDTSFWKVVCEAEKTNYSARKDGTQLLIEGLFKGKKVTKKIKVPRLPFFPNPKISLMTFVKSNNSSVEFWGIRGDTLDVYKMIAYNKGPETISINGKDVASTKVYWTTKGISSIFFNRTYWFRKSDSMFIKQTGSNGIERILTSEE